MLANLTRTLAALVLATLASTAVAQNADRNLLADEPASASDSWYGETAPQPKITPQMIIQQKAQVRAYQRIARIESMKWYGMSASRPLASSTPFAGVPSPRWEMPGGRPFSWYPSTNTTVIVR